MAKQTIIVMSDSHGDRSIVEAIKEKYLDQVDGIFHNGIFMMAIQNAW